MSQLLELAEVTHYYGSVCALRNVSMDVPSGAVGLVGQNGAGKSTLMQILLGLIRPSEGVARVLGRDVRNAGLELRGRIGYMPERETLVPGLHGIEYAALAGELYGMSRKQALRRAHETLSYLGLEDARYRKVEQYSVGMKQRLKLAASLVHDPELLLLDEPTSGLDPEGRNAMLALLCTLASRAGKSLILSSHLLGDIERVCRTAIILDRGQVLRVGRLEDLKTSPTRSYRLRWKGEADGFLAAIRGHGGVVQHDGRSPEAVVTVDAQWETRRFFEAANAHRLPLVGLEPEEENLEAVYHRLIGPGAASGASVPSGSEAAGASGQARVATSNAQEQSHAS